VWSFALTIAALAGCVTVPPPAPPTPVPSPAESLSRPAAPPVSSSQPAPPGPKPSTDRVIAKDEHFVIYEPGRGDTLRSLAREYLGDEERYWEIADFNRVTHAELDQALVIPLKPGNHLGVTSGGYQTVPILAYHRFGEQVSKMEVTPAAFAAQLDYLAGNDYRVVRLRDLEDFLAGKRPLPNRAVVITIDDGYASTYEYAFPLLKQHGFPATVFLYTDFVGARDALTWRQMSEMVSSGLIDIQAHSKTHANLAYRLPGESYERYRERLDAEARVPRDLLERKLAVKIEAFAYPYGDASEILIERLTKRDYRLAVTVDAGANAFFADPLLLHRSMVLGDQDLETFKAKLRVFREVDLR
jgi:peptidoglycan/xylan/chitin deacetylase (PgdA/CDA1 family)